MGFQNQGRKTGSFAVTHGPTLTVASMLLSFSYMNSAQKWNPKLGPKLDPNQDPKIPSGAPNLYKDANKDVQTWFSFNGLLLSDLIQLCATNQQLQSKKAET